MHGHINVRSPNTSKWQVEFNSAFKVLMRTYVFSQQTRITNSSLKLQTHYIHTPVNPLLGRTCFKLSESQNYHRQCAAGGVYRISRERSLWSITSI
jgi:hypothetical protein